MRLLAMTFGLALGLAASAQGALVGYWNLNEPSGTISDLAGPVLTNSTNALAASEYGKASVTPGTYGSSIVVTPGQFGTSINIPTNNSFFLGSPVGTDLNLTGDFTVMAWMNPTQTTGSHVVFSTGAGGENGWKFGTSGNQLRFTANGVADVTVPAGDFTFSANQWYHYAVSVTGTVGARTLNFYINGELESTLPLANINPSTAISMLLGNNGQENPATPGGVSFNENFNGRLDEVRIYNTVLSLAQIRAAAVVLPEPGTLGLLAIAGAALLRRRRMA